MANTFGENMADKKLTVKSLRVLQEVDSPSINSIKSELAQTNQTIASLQGVQEKYWNSIADDNIITPEEKRTLYKEKQTLDTEYSIVIKNAENMTDYVDYEPLIEAYNNLNSYLAMIKVFESMSSNTKIDDRSEFYSVYDAYYQALNNVNQAILGHTTVGEIIVDNPDMITGLKAVASEEYIYVSFNPLDANIKNNIQRYVYSLNKGDGVWFNFNSQQNGFYYYFDRIIDGFPESDVLENWEWKVQAVSVYGKESEESRSVNTNIDTYGTWIPEQPEIITTEQKRFISFSFSQKLSSKEVYGQLRYGLTIQNPLKDGEVFYTPALDKIPTENEDNYKLDTNDSVFVTSYFSQSLPLTGQNNKKWKIKQWQTIEGEDVTTRDSVSYNDTLPVYPSDAVLTYNENGQIIGVSYSETVETLTLHYEYTLVDMPSPIDTMYRYKVVMWNKTSNQFYDVEDILTVYARANSASDLVDNAITQNALAPDAVTADKIAAGTITAENIAAGDILAKGARAGMVSTEGLIVDNSAFLASKPLEYKYNDPVTGEEKNYIANAGEFFVGNTPEINDDRDDAEFLHYKNGGFWFKIKNFIIKGLSTVINGIFVVKKNGESEQNSFFVANATDSYDETTRTTSRTVKTNGDHVANNIFCDGLYLGKPKISTMLPAEIKYNYSAEKFFYFDNRYFFLNSNKDKIYEFDENFENIRLIKQFRFDKNNIIVKDNTIIATGGDIIGGVLYENVSISYDNGVTWNSVENDLPFISKAFMVEDRIFFYTSSNFVYDVYYTDDFFQSYTKIFTFNNNIVSFGNTETNKIYIGDYYTLQFSSDKGETFTPFSLKQRLSISNSIGDTLVAHLNSYNYVFIKKETDEDFVQLTDKSLWFKEDKDVLVSIVGNTKYVFDGENLTEEVFLKDITVSSFLAVTDKKYLVYIENGKQYVTINKDEQLENIISDTKTNEISTWSSKLISEKLENIYPVGSIYMSVVDNSPEKFYGGFWVKLKDRFLLAAGEQFDAGSLGGKDKVTLTTSELPKHRHSIIHKHNTTVSSSSIWTRPSGNGAPSLNENTKTDYRGSASSVTVSVTANTTDTTPSSSATSKWSDYTGTGNEFSILPPYLVVYMWKRVVIKYTLSFDSNGGIGEIETIKEEPGVVILPENKFTKEGYKFNSYNTKPDATGIKYMPGENYTLENNVTLYAVWDEEISIPAGTYTPESFRNIISQFISKGGSRTCKNEFTATVNNTTITVPANSTIYYTSSYDGVETIGFGTDSIGPLGGSFSTYKQYIVYANTDKGSFFSNYTNFTITVDDITFN